MQPENEYLLKKNRNLSRALIASGAINIIVLALFSYWISRERLPTPYCQLKSKKQTSVVSVTNPIEITENLRNFSKLTSQQLVDLLQSNHPIGPTYLERDLALACLVAYHHFDLARSLKPQDLPKQKHVIKLTSDSKKPNILTLYPDLSSRELNAIIKFANTERWPMTPQGLFLMLKKQSQAGELDPTLIEAFALTSEFWSMELLLSRTDQTLTRKKIAHFLADGNWENLKQFAEQQSKLNDFSDSRRRQILLEYIQMHSSNAAEFLLKFDPDFALKKLEDQEILLILDLLAEKTDEGERFAKRLLTSPRHVKVWQKAAHCLYSYAGEQIPVDWDYQKVLARFIYPSPQQPKPTFQVTPLLSSSQSKKSSRIPLTVSTLKPIRLYTVQSGDSLWKISRKFNVSINKIKEVNRLTSDILKPGTVLKIP